MFVICPVLLFVDIYELIFASFLFQCPYQLWIQLIGAGLMVFGIVLANLGRIARGVIAPSWTMPENYKLATKGAYGLVRHPIYSSYMLMALDLFLLLSNVLLLGCFVGLIFYYFIAKREEEMLVERFGSQYVEYKRRVGMIFPKIGRKDH